MAIFHSKNPNPDAASAACRVMAPGSDGDLPSWVELLPAGPVIGRDGRRWLNDDAQRVVDAFAGMNMALPVDVEHSTELKGPEGEPAPAVGWVEALEARNGAVWAQIDWNDHGAELIRQRRYRYFSPVFVHDKHGRIQHVTSIGLTNQPNLHVAALNRQHQQVNDMSLSELIAKALGLDAAATEEDAVTAINRLKEEKEKALNRVATPSLDKYVPRADFDKALNRAAQAETALAEFKQAQQEAAIEAEVEAALAAGKITPATVEYHKAQCRTEGGLERFRDFVKSAPEVGGGTGLPAAPAAAKSDELTEDEKAICRALGQSEEEFKSLKAKEAE